MTLAVLALAGLLYWMYRRGELQALLASTRPKAARWLMAAASGLLALGGLRSGNWVLVALGIAALIFFAYGPARAPAAVSLSEVEARALLGLEPAATRTDVDAAWRRLIAQVHPDKGGSAELARRVTAARDLLLSRLETR